MKKHWKKLISAAMLLILVCTFTFIPTIASAASPTAFEITYQNCSIYESDYGSSSYYSAIVEIRNTGSVNLRLDDATFDFEDRNGHLLETKSYVSCDPDIIAPGEKGYFYSSGSLDYVTSMSDCIFKSTVKAVKAKNSVIPYAISDLSLAQPYPSSVEIKGRITNPTKEENGAWVFFVLYRSDGTPITAGGTNVFDLLAGETRSFSRSFFPYELGNIEPSEVASYKVCSSKYQYQFDRTGILAKTCKTAINAAYINPAYSNAPAPPANTTPGNSTAPTSPPSGNHTTQTQGGSPAQTPPQTQTTVQTQTIEFGGTPTAEMQWAYENGFIEDTGRGTYHPNRQMTNQQLWFALAQFMNEPVFSDSQAVDWALDNGLASGKDSNGKLTRLTMITDLYRCAFLMGCDVSDRTSLQGYADIAQVTGMPRDAVSWALANRITSASGKKQLNPSGIVSCAQFAEMLYEFSDVIGY